MKLSREIKTAFLVIGGVLLFIYGYTFLKGSSLLERDKTIYAIYDEVEGLVPGAKVTINGLSVGKISKIDFLFKNYTAKPFQYNSKPKWSLLFIN